MKYVVFDGDCGICSTSAQFIERNKINDLITTIPSYKFDLNKYQINESTAELSVIYIDDESGLMLFRARAITEICKNLKGPIKIIGYIFSNSMSAFILNPFYNLIARKRAFISKKLGLNACKI